MDPVEDWGLGHVCVIVLAQPVMVMRANTRQRHSETSRIIIGC